MSGCEYCEDGEGAKLIAYAREMKPLLETLLGNHDRRVARGEQETYSALSVVNALKLKLKTIEGA